MVQLNEFQGTPMCNALTELADELEAKNIPPVELNVIGGFALMLQGHRETTDITDIDYVGSGLSDTVDGIIRKVGLKHQMEPGWINNDGMLLGDSMESFELSTGKLHFEPAFTIGNLTINVLDEKDLLRLKVISVDTAMTELEATGDFARRKDFPDIKNLMDTLHMDPGMMEDEFKKYILSWPDTMELISKIYNDGPQSAVEWIDQQADTMQREKGSGTWQHSEYLSNLMDALMSGSKLKMQESDFDFVDQLTNTISM